MVHSMPSNLPNLPSSPTKVSDLKLNGDSQSLSDIALSTNGQTPNIPCNTPTSTTFGNDANDLFRFDGVNPAHATGSPGFLRGRGRGRPKLIGDELDAELVEYMVQVKMLSAHKSFKKKYCHNQ